MDKLADALSVLTPTALGAAFIVGLVVGAVYLAELNNRGVADPIVLLFSGAAFFTLVAIARYTDGAVTWDRNLGTGLLWCVFCAAAWVGLRIRWRRFP